jgi:hypothetical protein
MQQLRVSPELKRKVSLSSDGEMKILRERRRMLQELTKYLPTREEDRGFFQNLLTERPRGSAPPIDPNSFEGLKMRAKECLNAEGTFNIKWKCDNCHVLLCKFSGWIWFIEQLGLAEKAKREAPPGDEGAEKRFRERMDKVFAELKKGAAKRSEEKTVT